MATRTLLVAAAVVAITGSAAGCATPPSQNAPTSSAAATTSAPQQRTSAESQPSPATTTAPAPSDTGLTSEPCQLLTPSLAKQFAGDDAERRMMLGDPPVSVGGGACYYEGNAGSVLFSINPLPTDPDAPVNHFHVFTPSNEIPGLPFKAYRFGPGQSVVVVKDGLLLEFKVSNSQGVEANWDDDVKLAEVVVPRVG